MRFENRVATIRILSVLVTTVVPAFLFAQDTTRTSVTGFVDVYYAYVFQSNPPPNRSYTTQPLRINDFNLNLALIEMTRENRNIRGTFAFQIGTYVEANLAAEPALLKNVYIASAGTRVVNDVWVDAGIFPSHIGLEGIISKDNWNYSRSLLADYSPYYEAGVSVTAPVSDKLTLRGLILNGWQNIDDSNRGKSLGTQVVYKPTSSLLVNWSSLLGNEAPDTTASRLRFFNDFFSVLNLSDFWTLAAIFDFGVEKNPVTDSFECWNAAAVMIKYVFDHRWTIAGRAEYYYDAHGIIISTSTRDNFQTASGSINLDFAPTAELVWRLEVRIFGSRDAIYPKRSGFGAHDGFWVFSGAVTL